MHRHPLRQALRLPQAALKRLVTGLLQLVLLANRPARLARSGFVLPTTVLLVLMVVLTVTAMTYRSFTRSDMAISQRDQQEIANAASPAIDRAKAKIEFLFRKDPRFPSGVPSSDVLADLMLPKLGNTLNFVGYTGRVPVLPGGNSDPYTLPGEQRVDINDDGYPDNAWSYTSDTGEMVVYSVLVDDRVLAGERNGPTPPATPEEEEATPTTFLGRPYVNGDVDLTSPNAESKANALITRTGPLATTEAVPQCQGAISEGGWQVVSQGNNSSLQKNFLVNAFVAKDNGANVANRTFETLEFQQSRIASRASKWGAWFRYDLEIHPGPDFKWNGAMHTDGSLKLNGAIQPFKVSSFNSCLYTKEASEITLGEFDNDGAAGINLEDAQAGVVGDFQGQVLVAKTDGDQYTNDTIKVHVFDQPKGNPTVEDLKKDSDSVLEGSSKPADVAMNPLLLYTQEKESHIDPTTWSRDANWATGKFTVEGKERILNEAVARPFVDDLFRADNRWGPKPRYNSNPNYDLNSAVNTALSVGSDIDAGLSDLNSPGTGLDGYWERRAIATGLRFIVGERLELGNTNEWRSNPVGASLDAAAQGDPLYPPTATGLTNAVNNRTGGRVQHLQRKSLRDNLAAVQGMAIYHYDGAGMATNGEFPMACYALTAHPGTPESIINSRTFGQYANTNAFKADFFNGNGTNGWEFKYNAAFDTPTKFATQVASSNNLGKALRNLSNFAGDPAGGAPSFPVSANSTNVHPYPNLAMWGDFSMLRRVLAKLDSGTTYAQLSFADQSTLHTAACTLGMLAYNVDQDYISAESSLSTNMDKLQAISGQLTGSIASIMDCMERNTAGNLRNNGQPWNDNQKDQACKQGNFSGEQARTFLRARNFMDTAGNATWTDPNPNTVLPGFSFTKKNGTVVTEPSTCPAGSDKAGFQSACDSAEFFDGWKRADWVAFLQIDGVFNAKNLSVAEKAALADDLLAFSESLRTVYSVTRDRDLGFRAGLSTKTGVPFDDSFGSFVPWDAGTRLSQPISGYVSGNDKRTFKLGCNPNIFQDLVAKGGGGQNNILTLGLVACSEMGVQPIRYPALYYIFPTNDHDHDGAGYHQQPNGTFEQYGINPYTEEYIDDAYIKTINPLNTNRFFVVGSDDITGVTSVAAVPKQATLSDWVVPHSAPDTGTLSNPDTQPFTIAVGTSTANVAFLDKGIYNGRELLNTRVLDVDLARLTNTRVAAGKDYWLPANRDNNAEGVVYAFREDAVREDEILRPKKSGTTIATCTALDPQAAANDTRIFAVETKSDCQMNVQPGSFQDPPLTAKGISLKPVDFAPDPQRRVHGFRLRTADGSPADFSVGGRQVGMTFVSDNGVYIMGDFNPHSSNGSITAANLLEEFTQKITDKNFTFDNFYKDRTTLNTTAFATLASDHWRPVEVLADAIHVLSGDFKDGSVADTFVTGALSSYTNQPRPAQGGTLANWVHEGSSDTTPVWVDRNGTYYYKDGSSIIPFYTHFNSTTNGNALQWIRVQDQKTLMAAKKTYVNAVFVGGISPSRPNQGYGGLHNYPRFLENWAGQDLFIQGSFIQLNFTTSNTAPFEQEALEPGQVPDTAERIAYYRPPNRRWGYDVGLLYVPPAPAARRFVVIGSPRSEYYRELPADDPYIVNLRCAAVGGTKVMPNLCPA